MDDEFISAIDPDVELPDKIEATKVFRKHIADQVGTEMAARIVKQYEVAVDSAVALGIAKRENDSLREENSTLTTRLLECQAALVALQQDISTIRIALHDAADELVGLREDILDKPRWYHKLLFWR
jgi:hypothetical protein